MRPNTDPLAALMRYVNLAGDGCWIRSGAAVRGYPVVKVRGKQFRAARLSYELHKGVIPDGLTVDHLCRETRCVNPDHLELVTAAENARRERAALRPAHCPSGHGYAEHGYEHGGRVHCRRCRHDRQMRWRKQNPERWRELKRESYERSRQSP